MKFQYVRQAALEHWLQGTQRQWINATDIQGLKETIGYQSNFMLKDTDDALDTIIDFFQNRDNNL